MADNSFNRLSTVEFNLRMKACAKEILEKEYEGSSVDSIADEDEDVQLWIDKNLAIDRVLTSAKNRRFTMQEKYRRTRFLYNPIYQVAPPEPDFTQEYMNGFGTAREAEGEWFHLHADLYFYGWANEDETGFDKWILLDVWRYKRIVWNYPNELNGIGNGPIPNDTHGRATFYAIPVNRLEKAIVGGRDLRIDCPECLGEGWTPPEDQQQSCPVSAYYHNSIPVCASDCDCEKDEYGNPTCAYPSGDWSSMPKIRCAYCVGCGKYPPREKCAKCDGFGKLKPRRLSVLEGGKAS